MRIRFPFAGAFFLLLVLAGYAGLTTVQVGAYVDDKLLHATTFFALTLVFYWIVDTTRRRALNLTLAVCTAGLGLGSEVLQAALPNGRDFDAYDVLANLVGSLAAIGLCSWYHRRMLDRKRTRKLYNAVPGEEPAEGEEQDLELGEGVGLGASSSSGGGGGEGEGEDVDTHHEEGVITTAPAGQVPSGAGEQQQGLSLEQEVDNWDENAVDAWDEDEDEDDDADEDDLGDIGTAAAPTAGKVAAGAESKKRID